MFSPSQARILQQKCNNYSEKQKQMLPVILSTAYSHENFVKQSSGKSELPLSSMIKPKHNLSTPVQWPFTNPPFYSFLFYVFRKKILGTRCFTFSNVNSHLFLFEVMCLIFILKHDHIAVTWTSETFTKFLYLMTKKLLSGLQKYDSGKYGLNGVL